MIRPQIRELLVNQQRDVRGGIRFTQPQQRGRGHAGVAEPVDPAHENSFEWRIHCEWRFSPTAGFSISALGTWRLGFGVFHLPGFQRLWTQNQFAGSRRMATSKARLTSSMIDFV